MTKQEEIALYSRHVGFLYAELQDACMRWWLFRLMFSLVMLFSSGLYAAKLLDVAVGCTVIAFILAAISRLEKKRAKKLARIFGRSSVKLSKMMR